MISIEEITIGMPVNISVGSDSDPYEVIDKTSSEVIVRRCTPINMEDWASGNHTTEYVSDPNGSTYTLSCRGKHGWHVKGDYRSRGYGWCRGVCFGIARHYRDPSF
jgi:hypothetical protein